MTTSTGALRAWLLAAALAIGTTTAVSVPARALFARDNTCGDTTYSKCPQAGFPDNFCCKPGTSCISLAGNTTILCCPDGDDCAVIAPIVCNIQLQDASTNPQAGVKTTALTSELPKCGSNCCPFGYTCDNDQNCVKNEDQTKKPDGAVDASSTAALPTSTAASTGQASTAAPSTSSASSSDGGITATAAPEGGSAEGQGNPDEAHKEGANTSAIVGGVVGGVLLLLAVIVGIVYLVYRHRKDQQRRRASSHSLVSSDARRIEKISGPFPNGDFPQGRSDFIAAKSYSSANSTPSQAQGAFVRTKSVNSRGSYVSYDARSLHHSAMVQGLATEARPQVERQASDDSQGSLGEYVDIALDTHLAVPGIIDPRRNLSRDTTLTQWPGAHPAAGGRR
ncbi:hypothetical protein TruAng_006451 [Truncatella angustata]|nr:hypothetical protein TruAng_006451 [Truncatella angustata]